MPHANPQWNGSGGKEPNTSCLQKLGINSAELEGAGHHVVQALVDFALAPEEALAVLDPFEITDGDAAGVAENVGHGEDALGINNRVGLPSGGAVRALTENFCLDLFGVLFSDLVFDGRRNGDLARLEKNVARSHLRTTAREILE